jgi:probable phosphoglycerate mutase
MKEYYIIRHGQTDYNKLRIVQGSGVDSDLNEKGVRQSHLFYDYYKKIGFEYVICSGLKRSYQTIEPFVVKENIPHEKTSLINEISWGVHEGQKGTLEMKQNYDVMVSEWGKGNFDARLEAAESASELANRVKEFVAYLTGLPYQRVLVCTHGRTLRCLMCLMKGQHLREMENYDHHNTGLFLAEYVGNMFNFKLENDISHFQ